MIINNVNESLIGRCGWLGGAILDVHDVEPLPEDNPLWDLPGVRGYSGCVM